MCHNPHQCTVSVSSCFSLLFVIRCFLLNICENNVIIGEHAVGTERKYLFCILHKNIYYCPVSGSSQTVWRYSTGDRGSKRFCNAFLSSKAKSTQHVLGLISHKAIKHTILWHDIYVLKDVFSRRVPFICNVSVSVFFVQRWINLQYIRIFLEYLNKWILFIMFPRFLLTY